MLADINKLSSDFVFRPNLQCAAIDGNQHADTFKKPGVVLDSRAIMGTVALGSNEPDIPGLCLGDSNCDSFGFRSKTQECLTNCKPASDYTYPVTGCGFWPIVSPQCQATDLQNQAFPFQCFGDTNFSAKGSKQICGASGPGPDCCTSECRDSMNQNFYQYYLDLAKAGFEYASTPIIAADTVFLTDLLGATSCAQNPTLKGADRLKMGCPTHSAFHFYSSGCPSDLEKDIADFKNKVQACKK